MPTVAIVDEVKIQFFFGDHPPAHFHVDFAGMSAQIRLSDLEVIEGHLPAAKLLAVRRWAATRRRELRSCWEKAIANQNPGKVE
jgi:hypothetical protein